MLEQMEMDSPHRVSPDEAIPGKSYAVRLLEEGRRTGFDALEDGRVVRVDRKTSPRDAIALEYHVVCVASNATLLVLGERQDGCSWVWCLEELGASHRVQVKNGRLYGEEQLRPQMSEMASSADMADMVRRLEEQAAERVKTLEQECRYLRAFKRDMESWVTEGIGLYVATAADTEDEIGREAIHRFREFVERKIFHVQKCGPGR